MNARPVKVLVVDDQAATRRALRASLSASGYEVEEALSGEEAIGALRRQPADLVLLDVEMPGIGGVEACRRIRPVSPRTGIVMVTVCDTLENKVEALEAGADDYITKPFLLRELTARLRAVVRRTGAGRESEPAVLRAGAIEMDLDHRAVLKAGQEIHLSPIEFDLLLFFMQHPGVTIEHGKLLRAIWGPEYGSELEYLRTYIRMLRKKIEANPAHPEYILTEPWVGYRFRDPVAVETRLAVSKAG